MNRLLVVDDEPHATRLLQRSLQNAGFEVDIASDGAEALDRVRANDYAAVLTDICMPRMSGRELCTAIRQEALPSQPFIVVLTSRPEDEHREWTRSFPRLRFMEKPVSLKRLVEVITDALDATTPPTTDLGDVT